MKNPAIELDYFFNEVRVKQLLGIIKNNRPNYRSMMCGKNLHPIVYDIMRKYNPVNWHLICLEFPHIAKDGVSVGYYVKADNVGKTVTTCKIGKYVKRHFPMLPDHIIRDYVNPYVIKTEIIDNIDIIVDLMQSGKMPNSCMTKNFTIHPYRVYDPKYGWKMVLKKSGEDILGRALINGMNYVRAYTSSTSSITGMSIDCALEAWLDSQGYKNNREWPTGTKLARYETRNGDIVAPYIDGNNDNCEDCGTYLRICSSGDLECSNTDGTATRANSCTCDMCGYSMDDDNSTYIENEDISICEHCLNRYYVYISETRIHSRYIGGYYRRTTDCIETIDGEYYPDDAYSYFDIVELHNGQYTQMDNAVSCGYDYYHTDDIGTKIVEIGESGEYELIEDCTELHNGEYALTDDCTELHNGEYALTDDCTKLHDGEYALIDDCIELDNGEYALSDDIGTIVILLDNGEYSLSQLELL